jgi:hypothetical protein
MHHKIIVIALAELGSALYVSYHSLPEHEQVRLRMLILRNAATVSRDIAERFGRIAIDLEKAYYRETAHNG